MKRLLSIAGGCFLGAVALSGCSDAGEKTANLSLVYLVTAILSILLFIGCFVLVKNRGKRILLLFASVAIVNIGYYWLSVSPNLTQALLANGLAYLGSAFLPFFMLMIILGVTKAEYKKWFPIALGILGLIMFIIASSPLYCDIYYKSVEYSQVNGVTVLVKEYGSLHILYMLYLLFYFALMIATVVKATVKKKISSSIYAIILNFAVFVNIAVWLMEQFVKLEFELLSVSYIISELFLLGLFMLIQDNEKKVVIVEAAEALKVQSPTDAPSQEQLELFAKGLDTLTHTEKTVYGLYLSGKTTKEIMAELNITENTLKFHNKNLYGKLGVTSRKQMLAMAKHLSE